MRKAASGDARPALGPASGVPSASPAPDAAAARRPAYGAALGAAIGFLGGAIFWHTLGVSISEQQPEIVGAATAPASAPATQALVTGSLPTIVRVDPASCTGLELDRQTNRIVVRPCPAGGLALRLDSADDREDLAILAGEYDRR